jgi:PAS domain S-box-containing protein
MINMESDAAVQHPASGLRDTAGTGTLELLNRAGEAIAAGLDIEVLVRLVVDVGVDLSGAAYGAFFYQGLGESADAYAWYGLPESAFAGFQLPADPALLIPSFYGQGVIRCDDIQTDPHYASLIAPYLTMPRSALPVRSYLAVPVRSRGNAVLGGLFFAHPAPGIFNHRCERAVKSVAALAAVALDNARLYRATQSEMEDRLRAEGALRESEAQFRAITDSMPQLVWSAQADGTDDYYNSRWFEYTGLTPESNGELGWSQVLHPDDRERAWNRWLAALEQGIPYEDEYRLRRRDGIYRWVLERAMPIRDEATGSVVRWLGTCTDVHEQVNTRSTLAIDNDALERAVDQRTVELADTTVRLNAEVRERARAEDALRQAQKMESLGQLTGGVAHDFNNLLTVVIGNLETLQRRLDSGQPLDVVQLRKLIANAARGADRAATLTQRLLAFARRQPLEPVPLDVNRLVADMSELLRRTLGEQIELTTLLDGTLSLTLADRNQLENATLNLAVNARDAMPQGGRLTIRTFNQTLDEREASALSEVSPGRYIVVAVTDTGVGMDAEVQARAIEPFFTTKEVGSGTGLGLSQVYGFIKQSGGHLRIESRLGGGTTVSMYLPQLQTAVKPAAAAPPEAGTPLARPGECVLVVEDDADVRQHSINILRELGYAVLAAADARAALAILEQYPDIALLFTDIGLPGGMSGIQLAQVAAQRRRARGEYAVKVLFTSAYARDAIIEGRLDADMQLISKPFTYVCLGAKVRETIDKPTGDAGKAARRILIVEDEVLVRMFAVDSLEDEGFQVDQAETGAQALALLDKFKDEISAVVIDLGLPDRPGDQIATEMRQLRQDLPILIASGRSEKELRERFSLDGRVGVMVKPFTGPMLIAALEKIGISAPR